MSSFYHVRTFGMGSTATPREPLLVLSPTCRGRRVSRTGDSTSFKPSGFIRKVPFHFNRHKLWDSTERCDPRCKKIPFPHEGRRGRFEGPVYSRPAFKLSTDISTDSKLRLPYYTSGVIVSTTHVAREDRRYRKISFQVGCRCRLRRRR